MPPVDRREKERRQVQYADAKEAAAKSKGGFEWTTLSIPQGIQVYKFKAVKTYRINILPFVTKQGNPNAAVNRLYYERTYWTHTEVGPDEKAYCCPLKNWGQPCCLCEHVTKLRNQGADDTSIAPFKPKKRQLWLFDDVTDVVDPKKHKPNPQLFETAYFGGRGYKGFGEAMDAKIALADPGDPATRFYRLDSKGMTLRISTAQSNFRGNTYFRPDELEFVDRKEVYDEEMELPCLDEFPKQISSKELHKIFHQVSDDVEQSGIEPVVSTEVQSSTPLIEKDAASPLPIKKPSVVDSFDDDITADDQDIEKGSKVKHKRLGKCKVMSISDDGLELIIKDSDGELHKRIKPSDCTLMDSDNSSNGSNGSSEEPKPKVEARKPTIEEDDEEDEWGDSANVDDDDD